MDFPASKGPKSAQRAELVKLLVRQFELHEASHHKACECLPKQDAAPTAPLAHDVADVYKCLHQGEFGVGHSIDNPVSFGRRLTEELLGAVLRADEPVLENVSLNSSVFRVNLRPYRQLFIGNETTGAVLLFKVCLHSASMATGSVETFLCTLADFRDVNSEREIVAGGRVFAFPPKRVDAFLKDIADFIERFGTVPVLSHSDAYKNLNAPSYRVVDRRSVQDSPLAFLLGEVE